MKAVLLQRINLILIILAAGLAALLFWGSVGNLYQVHSNTAKRAPVTLNQSQANDIPAVQKYIVAAQQREVFKQSVIYETKKGPAVNILDGIQFLGVTMRGDSIRAVLFNSKTGTSSSYAPGEMMGDLKINEIRADRVVFSHGAETLELIR